jgi:hypothetical protein
LKGPRNVNRNSEPGSAVSAVTKVVHQEDSPSPVVTAVNTDSGGA